MIQQELDHGNYQVRASYFPVQYHFQLHWQGKISVVYQSVPLDCNSLPFWMASWLEA
jgi:hypothetical protein